MQKQEKRLLWSAAALALGLVSAPSSSQGGIGNMEARAIDRLPEIRAALRATLADSGAPAISSAPGRQRLAQDWPNWSNWGNG